MAAHWPDQDAARLRPRMAGRAKFQSKAGIDVSEKAIEPATRLLGLGLWTNDGEELSVAVLLLEYKCIPRHPNIRLAVRISIEVVVPGFDPNV